MSIQIPVGAWIEAAPRRITRCPSYYAADYETLLTAPGEYAARVTFETGYDVPMPYWLLVDVAAERVDGRLYSGMGGNNFASTELPKGPARLPIQLQVYQIAGLVADGRLRLAPGFEWLASEPAFRHDRAPKTWGDVRALQSEV